MDSDSLRMLIDKANYWEHIKAEKELAFYLPPKHPKRQKINAAANNIIDKLNKEKDELR